MPFHSGNFGDFATLASSPAAAVTPYTKAIVGALIAGLGSAYQAADSGGISTQEWIAVAIATLTALGIVWGLPNADPRGKHQDESVTPPNPELGAGEVRLIAIATAGTALGIWPYVLSARLLQAL